MKVIIIRQRDADEKKPVCLVSGRICRDDTDADGVKFFPHPEMIGVTNFQSKKKERMWVASFPVSSWTIEKWRKFYDVEPPRPGGYIEAVIEFQKGGET